MSVVQLYLSVQSDHGIKMTASLEVCTKDKQHAVVQFLVSVGMNGAEIHRQWLPSMDSTVCYNKVCTNGSKCLKAAKPVLLMWTDKIHKQNMECSQTMILGNFRVTIVEIAARLGINVAHLWCKPLM
jgi:hypothetical protein